MASGRYILSKASKDTITRVSQASIASATRHAFKLRLKGDYFTNLGSGFTQAPLIQMPSKLAFQAGIEPRGAGKCRVFFGNSSDGISESTADVDYTAYDRTIDYILCVHWQNASPGPRETKIQLQMLDGTVLDTKTLAGSSNPPTTAGSGDLKFGDSVTGIDANIDGVAIYVGGDPTVFFGAADVTPLVGDANLAALCYFSEGTGGTSADEVGGPVFTLNGGGWSGPGTWGPGLGAGGLIKRNRHMNGGFVVMAGGLG